MNFHQARRSWSLYARRRSAPFGSSARHRRHLTLEALEQRVLLTVQPVDLAGPSLYGASGMLASSAPSISADGQLVAFASSADNLVPNDADNAPDAFVYNRGTGTVTLVSVGPDGMAAGIGSYTSPMAPVISPDGRYVAFENNSDDVLPGVTGGPALPARPGHRHDDAAHRRAPTARGGGNHGSLKRSSAPTAITSASSATRVTW